MSWRNVSVSPLFKSSHEANELCVSVLALICRQMSRHDDDLNQLLLLLLERRKQKWPYTFYREGYYCFLMTGTLGQNLFQVTFKQKLHLLSSMLLKTYLQYWGKPIFREKLFIAIWQLPYLIKGLLWEAVLEAGKLWWEADPSTFLFKSIWPYYVIIGKSVCQWACLL